MKAFFSKTWYYFVMAILLVAIYLLYKKAFQEKPVSDSQKVVQQLKATADSLKSVSDSLQIAYDAKQATIINNITYKNGQDAKTIAKLPNLAGYQRDSLWAVLFTGQDSLPGGYWSVLKQKTGGRTPKELAIQGDLQK